MATQIERLRFYEGEYLRSFDFEAEQAYHIEMRRRLNMALHLWGIVEGLDIQTDTEAGITQYSITPGMAIDAYGREIFVFAPYTLDDDRDLRANRITTPGTYELWIRYRRNTSTLPSAGYGVCNEKSQYTRWRESFKIVILKKSPALTLPLPTDPMSEDPDKDLWGVRLGTIQVNTVAGALALSGVTADHRKYIGLRAQRLKTPVDPGSSYHVLEPNDPLEPPVSLGVEANLFAERNLIVGKDFEVKQSDIKPTPATSFPNTTGNVKVAGDLFLKGTLYGNALGKWLGLGELLKSYVPDVQVGKIPVTFPAPTAADPSNGSVKFQLTSVLPQVTKAQIVASLANVQFDKTPHVQITLTQAGANGQLLFQVEGVATPTATSNTYDIELKWAVGPVDSTNATQLKTPIVAIEIAYVVVFSP